MSLIDKINQDLNTALKARDQIAVSILRFLLSKVHNAKIAKREELNDDEVQSEILKEVKRHKESIDAYEKAKRQDLVEREKKELEILQNYLPKQLSDLEIENMVDEAIKLVGAKSQADMGKVMAQVMAKVAGQADGSVVSRIVTEKLSRN